MRRINRAAIARKCARFCQFICCTSTSHTPRSPARSPAGCGRAAGRACNAGDALQLGMDQGCQPGERRLVPFSPRQQQVGDTRGQNAPILRRPVRGDSFLPRFPSLEQRGRRRFQQRSGGRNECRQTHVGRIGGDFSSYHLVSSVASQRADHRWRVAHRRHTA